MKIHRPISLILFLLLTLATARAQDSFVVMSVKGKVEFAPKKNAKTWAPLTVGMTLSGSDVVRTSYASYAKIMVGGRQLVSIDQNATRQLSTIAPKKSARTAESAAGSIMKYVSAQVQRAREDNVHNTYGAVRGTSPVFEALFPAVAGRGDELVFTWVDDDPAPTYEVIVQSEGNDIVDRRTVTGMSFAPEPGALALAPGGSYRWSVVRMTDGAASAPRSFRVLDVDSARAIAREVEQLEKDLAAMGADSVTTHVVCGVYFERRSLFADACREYLAAIRLAPDVDEYREILRGMLAAQQMPADESLLLR